MKTSIFDRLKSQGAITSYTAFFHSAFSVNGLVVLALILGAALLAMLTSALVAYNYFTTPAKTPSFQRLSYRRSVPPIA
jgi:hypothetical protein